VKATALDMTRTSLEINPRIDPTVVLRCKLPPSPSPVLGEISPFRFDLLPRPRIDGLLDSVLQHTVTVLEAPAGFGKTATLWQWYLAARNRGITAVRVALDPQAVAPAPFLEQLNRALRSTGMNVAAGSWVDRRERCIILIDNYPSDATTELDEMFGTLLGSAPPDLHIVVASRAPVRWPLCGMLLKGHAQRLVSEDLRFTAEEVARYLAPYHPSPDDLQVLERNVAGWQAALQVLRLSYERNPAAPFSKLAQIPPDLAIRYVTEQVLEDLPNPVVEVLIMTAALERANAPLLDAARNASDSDVLLQAAVQRGVPLAAEKGSQDSYVLHPFVRACLAREAGKLGEGHRRELHLQARRWFLEREDIEAAVYHARLAGDTRKVLETLDAMDGIGHALREGTTALERVFQQLPQQLLPQYPGAAITRSFLLAKHGRQLEARGILESARSAAGTDSAASTCAAGQLAVAEYFLAFAEDLSEKGHDEADLQRKLTATGAHDSSTKLLLNLALSNLRFRNGNLLGATDSALEAEFWCKELNAPYAAFFAAHRLCALNVYRGRLRAAREDCQRAEQTCASLIAKEPQLQILLDLMGISVHFERNDLQTSYRMLERSLPSLHRLECSVHCYITVNIMASRMEFARNGLEAALQTVTRATEFGDRRQLPHLSRAMHVQRADLLARAGQGEEALAQLVRVGVRMNDGALEHPTYLRWIDKIYDTLALARALLVCGDMQNSLSVATLMAEHCESSGALRFALRYHLLRALAFHALGQSDRAFAVLQAALRIATPEGALRSFIDEGEPMLALLKNFLRVTSVSQLSMETVEFIASLLGTRATDKDRSHPRSSSILTPREYDVLVELAAGHSNKLIARKLDLTENTVKFHLRSLYEKLGVGSRVLAIAVAREKGILTS
jgi:LuxR family transcriptional regulator, maltose regulon positive regulatory protein